MFFGFQVTKLYGEMSHDSAIWFTAAGRFGTKLVQSRVAPESF